MEVTYHLSRADRQLALRETKFFDCQCKRFHQSHRKVSKEPRCTEPMKESIDRFLDGVKCLQKNCKGVLLPTESTDQVECTVCNVRQPVEYWKKQNEAVTAAYTAATEVYKSGTSEVFLLLTCTGNARACLEMLESILSQYSETLHPCHAVLFNIHAQAINCSDALGDPDSSARHCKEVS